ncbi:hypothetical protein BHE97_15205 [Aeromicrobium sp. PE09-221]|nr:hypothetical protein BHE97_15205 [Aeromicrobium sp. PE09-221]
MWVDAAFEVSGVDLAVVGVPVVAQVPAEQVARAGSTLRASEAAVVDHPRRVQDEGVEPVLHPPDLTAHLLGIGRSQPGADQARLGVVERCATHAAEGRTEDVFLRLPGPPQKLIVCCAGLRQYKVGCRIEAAAR